MANAIYPIWKQELLQATANTSLGGTVKVALIDTGVYTYSAAHDFWDDAVAGVIGTPQTLASKTFASGVFDAADVVFPAVTGNNAEAIIVYIDTGVNATSRLVMYQDTGVTGLPVLPNGGDINLAFDGGANKIFAL